MKPWVSPHERSKLVKNNITFEKGRKMALEVAEWMELHESSFAAIYGCCKALQEQHVTSRAREHVMAFCSKNGIEVARSKGGFDNNIFAGVARYLIVLDPTLEGSPIELNDSFIDCYGLVPISYIKNW